MLGNDATGTDPANAGFADLDVADVPNVTPQDVLERDCLAIVVTSPQNPRLGRILRSVASQTLLPARLHIAVVGLDASTDNVQALAQKCLGEVDLPFVVQSSRGANFSQAVEDVLAGAGGPVVVEKNWDDGGAPQTYRTSLCPPRTALLISSFATSISVIKVST